MAKGQKGPPGFMIYRENAVSLMLLSAEERAAVCYAVCAYAVNGQCQDGLSGNAKMVADSMIEDIDRGIAQYLKKKEKARESIQKRWGKDRKMAEDTNEYDRNTNVLRTNTNCNSNSNSNSNSNTNGTSEAEPQKNNATAQKAAANAKKKYGVLNNVLLTDNELEKLKDRFQDWEDRIEQLSLYIESKGTKYKSHYATILNWERMHKEKQQQQRRKSFTEIAAEMDEEDLIMKERGGLDDQTGDGANHGDFEDGISQILFDGG